MKCLQQLNATTYKIADAQPIKYTECTFVLTQGSDLVMNPFNLTVKDANELAVSIITLWAIAYIWRTLSKLLENQSSKE